jgi:heterotetrameric sarcosine oxidase beta subunit
MTTMNERYGTIIIGAGVMGLGLAYQMARAGCNDILVIDKGYLTSGASGRNGGGLRQQWATRDNIELMIESMRLFRDMTSELGINVWLREDGYLFLLEKQEEVDEFNHSSSLQNELGLPTRLLTPKEAQRIVPGLNTNGITAAAHNPSDATIFPWPVIWGYSEAVRKLGVTILTRTPVTSLETSGNRITSVATDKGTFTADRFVNAAGAWGAQLASLVGIHCPNQPMRHEIFAGEPLKPFLDPMLVHFGSGLYMSQSMRGELIAGIKIDSHQPGEFSSASSWEFLTTISRAILRLLPELRDYRIMRQWAGLYDMTPDNKPIFGPVPEFDNFIQVHGFAGHGFMMAPATTRILADWMVKGIDHQIFDTWSIKRFDQDTSEKESFIIG